MCESQSACTSHLVLDGVRRQDVELLLGVVLHDDECLDDLHHAGVDLVTANDLERGEKHLRGCARLLEEGLSLLEAVLHMSLDDRFRFRPGGADGGRSLDLFTERNVLRLAGQGEAGQDAQGQYLFHANLLG